MRFPKSLPFTPYHTENCSTMVNRNFWSGVNAGYITYTGYITWKARMHICSGNKGTWKPRQKKIDYIEIDRKDYLKTTTEIKQKFEDFVVRNPVVAFLRLLFLNLLISYTYVTLLTCAYYFQPLLQLLKFCLFISFSYQK
jgi:hypothetical protein